MLSNSMRERSACWTRGFDYANLLNLESVFLGEHPLNYDGAKSMESCGKIWHCLKYAFDLSILIAKISFIVTKAFLKFFIPSCHSDISEDVVLITGGGRGIGRQLALEFAKYKPKYIILWGRNEETLRETVHDVLRLKVRCSYIICDVSVREQVYLKAEEVKKTIGDVTILVNNAGVVFGKHVVDICDEEMEIILNTNCLSHIWSIKAFLPGMMSSQRGHIVSMNSMLGLMGMRGCGDYCTSKHAATGLYESLWWELEDCQGIRLTSIHPYTVSNQMFEGIKIRFPTLFPMLQEDDVARQTVNAVLCNKKHVVIPRIMNFVIWSKSFLPNAAWFAVLKFTGAAHAMDGFVKRN